VIVDTKAQPRAGNIVLAFRHDIPGDDPVPLFRLWYPPYLLMATRSPGPAGIQVELVEDQRVILRGVVVLKSGRTNRILAASRYYSGCRQD
jgi:hypothetical protein